jgi:hypothetical protein
MSLPEVGGQACKQPDDVHGNPQPRGVDRMLPSAQNFSRTAPFSNRVDDLREHDWHGAGRL